MLEAYSRAWTEIDYDAIAHNVENKNYGYRQSQCVRFG